MEGTCAELLNANILVTSCRILSFELHVGCLSLTRSGLSGASNAEGNGKSSLSGLGYSSGESNKASKHGSSSDVLVTDSWQRQARQPIHSVPSFHEPVNEKEDSQPGDQNDPVSKKKRL